jgi:hypothetical protein
MQVFNFLWHDYEEQDNHLFFHPNKTEEQFREDCKKALVEVGDSYMDKEESWITLFDWISLACIKMEEYGYTRITPIVFSLWGNYIIEADRDESEILKEVVGERLLNKAIGKNRIIQEKVYKEL